MRSWQRFFGFTLIMVMLFMASSALAQWPIDPYENLMISNQSGAQTIPKIGTTSDGGCYISWYSNASGNYDMYLQRLDGSGVPQWQPDGMLISSHPQETWLTDYDMTVDLQDNAIITFNDIRAGGDWDIYAYRISSTGEFLWGPDGLTISANPNFEPDPRVIVTSLGNIVFAWQDEDSIFVRKVNPAGQDLWIPATKILKATYPLSIPRLAASNNDCVIIQYLMATGSQYWSPKNLYVKKFNASGVSVWPTDTVAVSTAGGFGPQMRPTIKSDDAGGVYSYWYDSRDMNLHAYAQHINSDGSAAWDANGILLSTTYGQLQGQPELAILPPPQGVLLFFPTTNMNQDHDGLNVQRLDATGARLLSDDGAVLLPLGGLSIDGIQAQPEAGGGIVTYYESPNDVSDCIIKAIRVDTTGTSVWETWPVEMSTNTSSKGYYETTINGLGSVIEVWEDERNDNDGDIYLQNINPDGSLGGTVGITDNSTTIPASYNLTQNYPNPFNATTMIKYDLPKALQVSIAIYDLLGRKVTTLVDGFQQAGHHQISWNAGHYSSGVYLYKLTTNSFTKTQKMQLLK